jgi:DNA-binding CsgD family transcriptional regulator
VIRLTGREHEVLGLVAEGLSNAGIAERLHIGVTTVKTHITDLMTRTESPNRVRLSGDERETRAAIAPGGGPAEGPGTRGGGSPAPLTPR